MEGKFMFRENKEALGKHEHVELILDDKISFRFHDVRKFGKMEFDVEDKIKENIHIPLVADIHFDYKLAIMAMERGIDKVRINPGNFHKVKLLKTFFLLRTFS